MWCRCKLVDGNNSNARCGLRTVLLALLPWSHQPSSDISLPYSIIVVQLPVTAYRTVSSNVGGEPYPSLEEAQPRRLQQCIGCTSHSNHPAILDSLIQPTGLAAFDNNIIKSAGQSTERLLALLPGITAGVRRGEWESHTDGSIPTHMLNTFSCLPYRIAPAYHPALAVIHWPSS